MLKHTTKGIFLNTIKTHSTDNFNIYSLVHSCQYMNAVLVIRQLKGVVVDHTQVVNDPCQTQHKATLLH